MAIVDFILNLVGLLLWLHWRSLRFDPFAQSKPATLAGTVRQASVERSGRWYYLAALVVLVFLRALIYWGIGSPAAWIARLDAGIVTLTFRSDVPQGMVLFSTLSFLRMLVIFYFWLAVLHVVNRRNPDEDAIQRLIRLHLGFVGKLPWPAQLSAPILGVAAAWMLLSPLLSHWDITAQAQSIPRLLAQGLLVGLGLVFSLKYVLPFILLLHLLTSYVYLGRSTIWDFVSATARSMLRPLQILPLRIAKFDFSPVVMVVLIFLLLDWLPKYLYTRAGSGKLNLWIQ